MNNNNKPHEKSPQCERCELLNLLLKDLELELSRLQTKYYIAKSNPTGAHANYVDYLRKKPKGNEVHRLAVGMCLQRHVSENIQLPGLIRLEVIKLLSEACVIIDNEDPSPSVLLSHYVERVMPKLPIVAHVIIDEEFYFRK